MTTDHGQLDVGLRFLGAVGTVTGSKFLLRVGKQRILVDLRFVSGLQESPPAKLGTVSGQTVADQQRGSDPCASGSFRLSAAALSRRFFPVMFCAHPARGICASTCCPIAALSRKRMRLWPIATAIPSITRLVRFTLATMPRSVYVQFKNVAFGKTHNIGHDIEVLFRRAGHIPGAATVQFVIGDRTIVFSGDLGHPDSPTVPPPEIIRHADTLVVESTYGNRQRNKEDPEQGPGRCHQSHRGPWR